MKLTAKILIPVGLILFVAVATIIVFFQSYLENHLLEDFFVNNQSKVERGTEKYLRKENFIDSESIESKRNFQQFFNWLDMDEIIDIVIWSPDGRIIVSKENISSGQEEEDSDQGAISQVSRTSASVFRKIDDAKTPGSKILDEYPHNYEIFVPIIIEREIQGIAELHLSNIFIAQIIKRIVFAGTALLVIFSVLIFLTIILILNRFIINPVAKIIEASRALQMGIWDANISAKKSNDEVGKLADAFEHMREAMRKNFVEMEDKKTQSEISEKRAVISSQSLLEEQERLDKSKKAMINILEDFKESKKIIEQEKTKFQSERDRSEGILRYLHSIREGIIATNQDGRLTFVNLTAAKMVSRSEGSPLIGRKYSDEFFFSVGRADDKKSIDPIAIVISSGGAYSLPTHCYLGSTLKKIPVPISGSFAPIIKEGQVLGIVSVFQDITERYNLEKEKDDFISITAHQLRTPLTGIRWTIESLIDGDAGKLTEEADKQLKLIFDNNQRMITLVNDLLDVSRINMGMAGENPEPVNVCKTLKEAIKALSGLAKERKVKVIFDKICSLNPDVSIGPRHFFQALENLISNAIKYTPSGGSVVIKTEYMDKKVTISVADTGIGIPKEDQDKIFGKFFRASNAVLKETDGSGLGLNVVKSFIEAAGGKVWFESQEKKGTTFFIEIPTTEKSGDASDAASE